MATLTPLGARTVVRLTGEATLRFLHDVSTQDVASLRPGSSALLAFLDDKGRILADARVTATATGALIDAEEAATEGLERAVARVAPLAGVEVEMMRWDCARYEGDLDPLTIEALGIEAIPVSWGGGGYDLLAPSLLAVRATFKQGGVSSGDATAIEEARIAACRPRFGIDIDATTLINETPLLVHAVSMTKGCYPGQESVARVHNLGRVRRMLRAFQVDGTVEPGSPISIGDEQVGVVTSSAGHHAMGFMKSEIPPGSRVLVAGSEASVTDAGWDAAR